MSLSEPISFRVRSTEALRRLGLLGEAVDVEFVQGNLVLRGPQGGCLTCASDQVERLRLGYEETKYSRVYLARIWRAGADAPLVLVPVDRAARAYGRAMRGFARAVVAVGGLARIERGLTFGGAMALPLSVLALGLAGSALALWIWVDRGFWGQMVFLAVMATLPALFLVRALCLDVPRPVRSIEALERYLPEG